MTMRLVISNNCLGALQILALQILALISTPSFRLFTSAQTCPSICPGGDELLNGNDVVEIGAAIGPCRFFDTNARSITDETVCAEYSQEAIDAGCKCGEPFACAGICLDATEELLNPTEVVKIDAAPSPCAGLDITFKSVIDPTQCTSFSEAAIEAGCKCGIPIDCVGICSEGSLLNADMSVTIGETTATCSVFDESYKSEIDPEACTKNSNNAMAAGCKCGEPIECPGICSEAGLANPDDTVIIDGTTATCGVFDGKLKNETDPDVCSEISMKAMDQGCVCGSQSSAPSSNVAVRLSLLASLLLIATIDVL